MRRLVTILVMLVVLAGAVLALAPWTVYQRALTEDVADQLREEFGLEFDVGGRTVIAFLPLPRLKFEQVSLSAADGRPLARGGELRGQLAVAPLLYGRIVLDEISLSNSRVDVDIDASGSSAWDGLVAVARRSLADEEAHPTITRIAFDNIQLFLDDARNGNRQVLRDVDMRLSWPRANGPIELSGSMRIRGETIQLAVSNVRPGTFLTEGRTPLELRATSRLGRLDLNGIVTPGIDAPWLEGRVSFETRAMRDLLVWSDQVLPLGPLLGAMSLEGEISGVGSAVSMPSVRMGLGRDRLEGALTARREDGRLSLNGTLAADTLVLDDFAAPFLDAAMPSGPWRFKRYDLTDTTSADLDLRLSAREARLRDLRMSDVALNTLVKPGRIEATLNRAQIHGGTARARLAVLRSLEHEGIELRAQGTAEQIDLGAAMREATGSNWLTGRAEGAFTLQAHGSHAFDLARNAVGEGRVTVRNGQFVGVALDDAIRRFESQPLTASRNLRTGMTAFEEARGYIAIADGLGKIIETDFVASDITGAVQGVFFIPDRRISARAAVQSKEAVADGDMVSALSFDIQGPWHDIAILPDANALIQRSGAARLLLGPSVDVTPLDELPAQ